MIKIAFDKTVSAALQEQREEISDGKLSYPQSNFMHTVWEAWEVHQVFRVNDADSGYFKGMY